MLRYRFLIFFLLVWNSLPQQENPALTLKNKSVGLFAFENLSRKYRDIAWEFLAADLWAPQLSLLEAVKFSPREKLTLPAPTTEAEKKKKWSKRAAQGIFTVQEQVEIARFHKLDYFFRGTVKDGEESAKMEIQLIETATAKPVRSVEFETVPEKLRTQLLRQTADLARSSGSFTEAFRAKLLAPKDLSNEMALVTMLLARAQDNAEKKMQQLREAVSLDPFAAEIRAEAEKAGLSPELKNAESKLRSEPYRAAAETRLWFLFYRNLYLYLETFGSESLLDFRVIQKKMNLSQEDRNMMEADLEVRVFRHPEFARYVLSCAKAFQRSVSPAALRRSAQLYTLTDNGQGREDQLLLMRGNGVKPYWEQIFRESQDSGGGDYISWLLGKICRHQMAFEFRLTLKDVETSEKIPEHGRLVFCPAGEVSSEGGRWVLAPAVNYAGEIFVYGLEYNNESQWSRSRKEQKSQGRILPVLSAQENNFRYEDYYRFSFGFPREFQNQQPVLQILEENEFVSPLQPYLDFQTLLK